MVKKTRQIEINNINMSNEISGMINIQHIQIINELNNITNIYHRVRYENGNPIIKKKNIKDKLLVLKKLEIKTKKVSPNFIWFVGFIHFVYFPQSAKIRLREYI